jgi:hypothetical protein
MTALKQDGTIARPGRDVNRGVVPDGGLAPWPAAPTVVLWDLDNVDPGLAGMRRAGASLEALAGSNTYQLVSGHPGRLAARESILLQMGYVVLPARARRNGADGQLLHAAGWLRRHAGVCRFVLASGDRGFWPLARGADVTVVVRSPYLVSHTLARHATRVVSL